MLSSTIEVPVLSTPRMTLEPLAVSHASESFELWQDESLYRFIPTDPPESEKGLSERYTMLRRGGSSDGSEVWLNWFMRERATGSLVGMVECTVYANKIAQLAYFVFSRSQKKGYAFEGCSAALDALRQRYGATVAQFYVDTRNARSIALAEKLGFSKVQFIERADFFKGAPSDEFRFALAL